MIIPSFCAGDLVVIVTPVVRRSFFLQGRVCPQLQRDLGFNCFIAKCAEDDCGTVVVLDMTIACSVIGPEAYANVWRAGTKIWPPFDVAHAVQPNRKESA